MKNLLSGALVFVPVLNFAGVGTVCAQQATPPRVITSVPAEPGTFGTASTIVMNLQPEDFTPEIPGTTYSVGTGLFTSGASHFFAPLRLPAGAVIEAIEFFYFDASSQNPSAALILRDTSGNAVNTVLFDAAFPNVANGNNSLLATLATPITINNLTTHYQVRFLITAVGGNIGLRRIRVFYRLQVSPPPGTATFADVPVGDPLHRFVEALVAAGITGGCGGGNYCPNTAITRGQMAVFLAVALGLHWPN